MKTNKITTVIIDDEPDAVNFIASIINEFCDQLEIIGTAHSVRDGVTLIEQKKPQLLLLDVEMPDGTGFNMLERIPDIDFHVVFITAYNHYAIQAIKFSAIDYILKPINIKELISAIEKVLNVIHKNQKFNYHFNTLIENLKTSQPSKIGLPMLDGIEFVESDEIVRIKAEGSYSTIFLKDKREILISRNLGEFQELLINRFFFRLHNSHLINLKLVKKYIKSDGGYVIMQNGDNVPISKSRKENFLKMMSLMNK